MAALRNSNRTTLTRGRSLIGPAALTILAALFIVAVQTVVAETAGRFLGALPIASAAESANVTPLGRGKMKRLVIQPKVVTFNRIPARMSETVTVTVGNPNSVAAQITSIRPHGLDFKVASNECTSPLAPAASCTLTVAFSPRTPGRKTGHLLIADNASADIQKVPLDGVAGTPTPAPSITPTFTPTPTPSSTPTPTFTPTPAPPHAGDVLIAVGRDSNGSPLSSAELYDPMKGTFAPTNSMTTARAEHFSMLLATGDVLVACGDQLGAGDEFDLSADLYSLATGMFSTTGGAVSACAAAAAATLNNGDVLVAGGGTGPALIPTPMQTPDPGAMLIPPYDGAAPQIYDPAKSQWHSAGNLVTGGTLLNSATTLGDGTVLVAGGSNDPYFVGVQSGAQIYSPMSGMFTATGSMNSPRAAHTATLLSNGKVLVAGGVDNTGAVLDSAELFDTGKFKPTAGNMTSARGGHRATLLGDGKVLLTGGIDATGTPLATAELYDPVAGTFAATGSMKAARYDHVAVMLNDGTVLIAGGTGALEALSSAEVYDPTSHAFHSVDAMGSPRTLASGTLLK